MDTSGFYKQTTNGWYYAKVIVATPTVHLHRDFKDDFTYPVEGWTWHDSAPLEYIQETEAEEILKNNISFGQSLIKDFLIHMRTLPTPLGFENSAAMLEKFSPVRAMAEIGDITNTRIILSNMTLDSFFTQELKDKFIQKIDEYIA